MSLQPKSSLIADLVTVARAYCAETGQGSASVAKAVFGRGGHLDALEAGERDLATGTYERAMAWFSSKWPEASAWPSGVARPVACEPSTPRDLQSAAPAKGLRPASERIEAVE